MNKEQLFSLEPDRELYCFLKTCKKVAHSLAGQQRYLFDDPHLTLYVNRFNNIKSLIEDLNCNFLFPKLVITLNGWRTFYNDPVTGGHTLAVGIDNESMKILRDIQIKLINIACKYRTKNILNRYQNSANFNEPMKKSLDTYGFPFVGKIWKGHFTVASFDIKVFPNVWTRLREFEPPEKVQITKMDFYNIYEQKFELINSWSCEK